MRQNLNDNDIEKVTGGTVYLSGERNQIAFDTLNVGYRLKCSFEVAKKELAKLYGSNSDMSEKEFDTLVRDTFKSKGYI